MAKMSDKKNPPKPSVCENFEPQAWRKTVCKNCFQAPEKHMAGGGAQSDSGKGSLGKEKMHIPAAGTNGKEKPLPGKTPMTSSLDNDKSTQKSAATSLKDKYEQLEKDKYKSKEPPKVAPKTKGPGGLSLLTNKYESVSGPSTPGTPGTPGTPIDKMEKPNIPLSKQGRLLDIKVSDRDSDEDVKSGKVVVNKLVKSKFGSIDNISDTEESSKIEVFQRSKFGSMENISLHNKKKEPIPIPIQKSKFGGSLDNVSGDKRQGFSHSHNKAADLLSKLDNFSIEIRAGATSNIGSTVIHQKDGGKVDIINIPIKRTSAPNTPTTDSQKPWSNKEAIQNQLNEHKQSKGKENDGRLSLNVKKDFKTPSPERDHRSKFSNSDLKSPTPEKFTKLNLKSPTREQNSKIDLKSPTPDKIQIKDIKSPTPDKDQKPDFKLKLKTSELKTSKTDDKVQDTKHEKVDFRAGLKKHDSGTVDSSKSEKTDSKSQFEKTDSKSQFEKTDSKSQFALPALKSTKSIGNKDIDKKETSSESNKKVDNKTNDKTVDNKTNDKKMNSFDLKTRFSTKADEEQSNNEKKSEHDKHKNKFEMPKLKSSRHTESDTKNTDSSKKDDKTNNTIDKLKVNSENDVSRDVRGDKKVEQKSILDKTDTNEIVNLTEEKDNDVKPNLKTADEVSDKNKEDVTEKTDAKKGDTNPDTEKMFEISPKSEKEEGITQLLPNHIDSSKLKTETRTSVANERDNKSDMKSETKSTFPDDQKIKLDVKTEVKSAENKEKDPVSKSGKEDVKQPELLSKFAKNDEKKSDSVPKADKQDDKKPELKSKFEKQEDAKPELLSRFAKKDENKSEPKSNVGKPDASKSGFKSKFEKQEDAKPELLSRFAKKDETKNEPKSKTDKPGESKAGIKSKFGKQEEEKSELLSRFAKKDEKKTDPRSKFDKTDEKKHDIKSKFGKQEDEKSELLSRFAKKDEKKTDTKAKFGKEDDKKKFGKDEEKKTELKSKFGKQDEEKSELLSRFANKDEKKNEPKYKLGKLEDKERKQTDEKVDKLSRFGQKIDKSVEQKSKVDKSDEKKTNFKIKSGKEEGKSELLSRFEKKKEENVELKEKSDKKPWLKSKLEAKNEEKPELKSKFERKDIKPLDSKFVKQDDKKNEPQTKNEGKTELKSKFERKDTKALDDKKNDTKSKFEKPELNKPDWRSKRDEEKNDLKSKFEKKDDKVSTLKQTNDKLDEKKNDFKSKFNKPELKSSKADEPRSKFEKHELKPSKIDNQNTDNNKHDTEILDEKAAEMGKSETSKQTEDTITPVTQTDSTDNKHSDNEFHSNKIRENENSIPESNTHKIVDLSKNKDDPQVSLISENHFDDISTEGEAISGDVIDACVPGSADDDSHVHVDTQVFTSSRQKTAGVIGQDEIDNYAAASRIGLSDLHDSRSKSKSDDASKLQNGDITIISDNDLIKPGFIENDENVTDKQNEEEFEKLRSELKIMVERCHNLEKENEQLLSGLEKKDSEVRDIKKDKSDIEASVITLQTKVKSIEEKCTKLESDNVSLSTNLKTQQDTITANTDSKEKEEREEKHTANDKIMADISEENETLKQEINELKMEMDEMYDSFRDQEAEEFRELQRELEITAKNCRILQFKLRKMERHSCQLELDKQHVEEKLRMLQNQFQDRDAVSHIHALEDELRMAKDVSVRLHDELDLMEDKRGKLEEENRHLTELLEQADRKQFRLEMEVDKLRDKIIELKQELRQKDDPTADRKVPLSSVGRQDSLEREMHQLKKEVYDSREREADLRDHLQFLESDNKTIQRKVTGLEEDNESLSKQIKKLSMERALACKYPSNKAVSETEVELGIQFDLAEKELTTLRRKLNEMEEENEMLHSEMFSLEQRIKEKDRQLETLPEPSSPTAYYEDKIREYEKEADEYRSKLLQRENDIVRLYDQLSVVQGHSKQSKGLRKSRSLEYETDYDLIVDLRRQLELSQQECTVRRDKIELLERENSTKDQDLNIYKTEYQSQVSSTISTLAVAYIDSDNEVQLRKQLAEMEHASACLLERIQHLSVKLKSLARTHYLTTIKSKESISKIPKPFVSDEINQTDCDMSADKDLRLGLAESSRTNRKTPRDLPQSFTFTGISWDSSCNDVSSDTATGRSEQQTINEKHSLSRDPYTLLSVIDDIFCEVLQNACDMETEGENIVPLETVKSEGCDLPEQLGSLDLSVSRVDFQLIGDDMSLDNNNPVEDSAIHTEDMTESNITETADLIRKVETMDLVLEPEISQEVIDISLDKNGNTTQMDKIAFLEEEIDDLRLIIKSKEEKNIALEDEVKSLETSVKTVQDDSRRREMELLNEMGLIHGRNEILNNLLEIVQQRAEAAEAELERVLAELHENSESTDSSDKTTPLGEISDGSDDVFDGSPADRGATLWEEQFKKRIRSLETLLAEERKKVSSLEKKLEITGSDIISTAMSDDVKLHQQEKELLQSELQESQRHALIANDQIRNLTEKLKKVESEKQPSPVITRHVEKVSSSSDEYEDAKEKLEPFCKTCSELQSVKDQLCEELYLFKDKADELEGKVEEINAIWVSKNAATEKEKHLIEQKLKQKFQDCKKLEEQLNKLREEDRMKDIFLKERDTNLKDKSAQIARKEELIQEQEDIIRQREEDMQQLFDQISQREKNLKEQSEKLRLKEENINEKDKELKKLHAFIDEKNEELHFLEEEMHETTKKRKESESLIQEMKDKLDENLKSEKSEIETENERLQSDVENLMTNITQLHNDKVTLQNELDKSKQALSEAMLMWDRDRSTLGSELTVAKEKLRTVEITANKKEPQAVTALRKEVHSIIETKERIALQALLGKIEHDNIVRLLKADKFKLTEELTSKIRMLTHEMTNNDKMADELSQLRGQDDINYQLHHHEKLLRAEYMAMKVRYETQLDRLQKEHMQLLHVVERLQREKNLDYEIISGIQKGMANIKETYTHDLSRWKDERTVLESHIKQIEEGKEIASHLRAQIDALKQQLSDQDIARTELVNKMTSERQRWEIEKANLNSTINQLEEQLALFVQVQSKTKDTQFRMEIAWEKEREEQKRLLGEAHGLAMDLQSQMQKRDEENAREKRNLLDQIEKHRLQYDSEMSSKDRVTLEVTKSETKIRHLEQQLEEAKENHKKDEDCWMKEKGDMLRRLAEMRKAHLQDSRRIDDVLTALKRLRELAAIVMESENSAMLPSNGTDGAAGTGDASAASSSVSAGEGEMADLKQNIDQIVLKYVKESLRQIHFATEELAKPPVEVTREEKQKMRRSLSSSEIDLLKDEFLIGPQDPGRLRGNGISDTQTTGNRERKTLKRTITHDGNGVSSDHLPSDYIENILMEQSSFYKDGKDTDVEVHRIRSRTETTRVETSVTSLPKPPPSFLIPRSRSTSPGPQIIVKSKRTQPIIKSISIDTTNQHRLSAPLVGASSRSSSADSSPVGVSPTFMTPLQNGSGLPGAGTLQSGSLDRLSPNAARKRFFEEQTSPSTSYLSWPERHKKPINVQRNSKSLSNSSEFATIADNEQSGNGQIRSSVSMDDSVIAPVLRPSRDDNTETSRDTKSHSAERVKHGSLMDMFKTMKRKLKPKVKRSHSDRAFDRTERPKVTPKNANVEEANETENERDEKHIVHERMTPIEIPPDEEESGPRKSRKDGDSKRDRSKSPKTRGEKDGGHPESTLQKLKKRFRSKSADRAHDHHVTPILVGHSGGSQPSDNSWQFSETTV